MDMNRYQELRRKLDADYKANIEALERVMALEKNLLPEGGVSEQQVTSTPETTDWIEGAITGMFHEIPAKVDLLGWIKEILSELPDRFTWMDVRAMLVARHPGIGFKGPSVRQAVMRLVELDDIEIVERGVGRAPSWYKASE